MIRASYAESVSFDQLDLTIDHLRSGGVVALPTDTQYALSAIATDHEAVQRVFELKRRPDGENLPVFLPPSRWRAHMARIAEPLDPRVESLAEAAWPGALTLIVDKRPEWDSRAVDGGTVALRIPDHPLAAALLDRLDEPLTGTSANLHGAPASLRSQDVRDQFPQAQSADQLQRLSESFHIPVLLDESGVPPAGTASTILDCTGHAPRVLRRGPMLNANVGELLQRYWGLADLDSVS